ncbi:hypothetical protein SCA6_010330 [Theobroma cacao]
MKKALHPSNLQSSRGIQGHDLPGKNSDKNQHKTHSVRNYFKAASRKLAGVFTGSLFRRRKKANADINRKNNQFQLRQIVRREVMLGAQECSSPLIRMALPILSVDIFQHPISPLKRFDEYNQGFSLQFKNEILTLSKIEHLNLVRLLGFLEHGDEQIIVVEYVGNGNLREHLDGVRGNGLEIAERLDIAIDVAHAITYLHSYTDPPIIHRDIKASNILITEKLRAKVADFGFARLASEDPSATHISTQVKGTAGYVDPEYTRTYQLTEKSDVYSFGVVLVELMTGRYPVESKRPVKERVMIRWAMKRLKEGEFVIAMDPRLRRSPASNMVVERVLKLAHQCLAPMRQSRPSMKKCAEVLWGIRKDFKEKASSSASHHSANFPDRDAKTNRQLFGIEEDESYGFISA